MDATPLTLCPGVLGLPALLTVPRQPRGLVVFVHGSGSSRFSPRNQAVAAVLQRAGLATLLFDLLRPSEQRSDQREPALGCGPEWFAQRLVVGLRWLVHQPGLAPLVPLGLFGASSGAAVALLAAAACPELVAAVVSRGGRPDLVASSLDRVRAPTLLIVGGQDLPVLALNRDAAHRLTCPHRLEVIPGAGHLFEQRGSLDAVAGLALDWFLQTLPQAAEHEADPARRTSEDRNPWSRD